MGNNIRKMALTVACFSKAQQKEVLKEWLDEIKSDDKFVKDLFLIVNEAYWKIKEKDTKRVIFEHWCEKRFSGNMKLTPKRVTYEYRYYKKINRDIEPYLIVIAQKVKNRLIKRLSRAKPECDCDTVLNNDNSTIKASDKIIDGSGNCNDTDTDIMPSESITVR